MNRGMSIFCDGACRGNGQRGAVGGWAWAYWNGEARGEPVTWGAEKLAVPPGQAATNQRAELTAMLEAIRWWKDVAGGGGPITIYSDSLYSINCTSKWGPGWRRAGWKRTSGEPLQNLDIIVPLVETWKPIWKMTHVRGHQTGSSPEVWGNNWVDRAAVVASEGGGQTVSVNAVVPIAAAATQFFPPSSVSSTGSSSHTSSYSFSSPPSPLSIPSALETKKSVIKQPLFQTDIRKWFGGA
jgi:ribonuclease HI